jgi:micrococcal nuclease
MRGLLFLVLFWLSIVIAHANGEVFNAKVVAVIDGNVFEIVADDGQTQRLSLVGIDCPESGQPFFEKAKKALEKIILNKEVRVKMMGKNRWGHYLALVTLVKNGVDPRLALLEDGLAWTAEKDPDAELESIRIKARDKQRGLWSEPNPTAPWIYRRQQTMMQAKSS